MSYATEPRQPNKVDFFYLYLHLEKTASKITNGKEARDGTTLRFLDEHVDEVLIRQGVLPEDLEKAKSYVIGADLMTKHDDGYSVTRSALANYHALLRRI